MTLTAPHRRAAGLGALVSGSVYGTLLTAAGLGIAYVVLATPFTSLLSTNQLSGAGSTPIPVAIWSLSLVAAGCLLLAGTNRLAVTLARLRGLDQRLPGPGAAALAPMADEVVVFADVAPDEGRAIPELAIGPFGAAVIHALPPPRDVRLVGAQWETRSKEGWIRTENPLELAVRDADRVRRWYSMADLDFVVRVYTALVVTDGSVPRSATCAVVTRDQLPSWIAALPPQRSLTAARRLHLSALAHPSAAETSQSIAVDW